MKVPESMKTPNLFEPEPQTWRQRGRGLVGVEFGLVKVLRLSVARRSEAKTS